MDRQEKYELRQKISDAIEGAACLYNIGEHKLRELTDSDNCNFVLYVERKRLIKRKQLNEYLSKSFPILYNKLPKI